MATGSGATVDEILAALRKSSSVTRKYFTGTFIFYVVVSAVITFFTVTAKTPEARGANIGILILVGLGFLGMWISPLRGLKGSGTGAGGFLNLFHLPLDDRIDELEDTGRWSDHDEWARVAGERLAHQAEAEREMRAWPNRMLSLVVITVIDLLIWLVWDNLTMALINQGIAMVVSQVHISTGPTASLRLHRSLTGK